MGIFARLKTTLVLVCLSGWGFTRATSDECFSDPQTAADQLTREMTEQHWSRWLLPPSPTESVQVWDQQSPTARYRHLYGTRRCRRNMHSDSLCPVHYVIQNDVDRVPEDIVHARCTCRRCRDLTRYECKPVYVHTKVMRRNDDGDFCPVLEAVPVTCSCQLRTEEQFPVGVFKMPE